MDMNELLDRAKTRANLPSDYALAKALGIPQSITTGWRKGKRHPSNEEAVQLATLAGLNEMQVIAEIELKTANTEKKKEFWKHYIESRGFTACLGLTAMAISIALTPETAEASVLQLHNYDEVTYFNQTENIHYTKSVKSNKLVFKALLSKWIKTVIEYSTSHNYKFS